MLFLLLLNEILLTYKVEIKFISLTFIQLYVIQDLVSNNKNNNANCMVYLAKKKVINLKMVHN